MNTRSGDRFRGKFKHGDKPYPTETHAPARATIISDVLNINNKPVKTLYTRRIGRDSPRVFLDRHIYIGSTVLELRRAQAHPIVHGPSLGPRRERPNNNSKDHGSGTS